MSRPRVYLDLDRTLFRTHEATGQIWRWLAQRHPEVIDADYEIAHRSDFYVWASELNYYHDLAAQLRARGLDAEKVYAELRHSELADGRLGFEGLDSLVAYLKTVADIAILTYGTDNYQQLKAALLPALAAIPIATTLADKATYFQEHHEATWLVDDKPLGHDLPKWVHFVQVSLEQPPAGTPPWPLFGSLGAVEDYFRTIFRNVATDQKS